MTVDETSILFMQYEGTKDSYYTSFYKSLGTEGVGGKVPKIFQKTRGSEQRLFLYSAWHKATSFLVSFQALL